MGLALGALGLALALVGVLPPAAAIAYGLLAGGVVAGLAARA